MCPLLSHLRQRPLNRLPPRSPHVPIDGSGLRQIIKGFHLRTSAPVQQADIAQALRFAVPMTEQLENVQRITKGLERLV